MAKCAPSNARTRRKLSHQGNGLRPRAQDTRRPWRAIALLAGFGIPLAFLLLARCFPPLKLLFAWAAWPAQPRHFCRTLAFFAQARHTVMLYYGAQRAETASIFNDSPAI